VTKKIQRCGHRGSRLRP